MVSEELIKHLRKIQKEGVDGEDVSAKETESEGRTPSKLKVALMKVKRKKVNKE